MSHSSFFLVISVIRSHMEQDVGKYLRGSLSSMLFSPWLRAQQEPGTPALYGMEWSHIGVGVFKGTLPPVTHSHMETNRLTSFPMLPLSLIPKPFDGCRANSRLLCLSKSCTPFGADNRGKNRLSEIDDYFIQQMLFVFKMKSKTNLPPLNMERTRGNSWWKNLKLVS